MLPPLCRVGRGGDPHLRGGASLQPSAESQAADRADRAAERRPTGAAAAADGELRRPLRARHPTYVYTWPSAARWRVSDYV